MNRMKTLFAVVAAFAAVIARAGFNSQYTLDLTDSYDISNILLYEENADGSSSLTWAFGASGPGTTVITNPFTMDAPTVSTLIIGLTHDLPGDAPGQKHVVLGMDDYAATLSNHIAWGTLFRNTDEDQLISNIELATSGQDWPIIQPGLDALWDFTGGDAKTGILGPGGQEQSALFNTTGSFSIMSFSEGTVLGTGVGTNIETTPEPASMLALGLGGLALIRRRRKAN